VDAGRLHLLDTTTGEWTVVVEGVDAQTSLAFDGDTLVGVTTLDAPNGRAVRALLTSPAEWATIVPERADVVLGAYTRSTANCSSSPAAWPSTVSSAGHPVPPPAASWSWVWPASWRSTPTTAERSSPSARSAHPSPSSGSHPTRAAAVVAAPDPQVLPTLTVSQVHYPSLDGTLIPMFVAHRADITPSADTPLILTGYGGFAIAESPVWMPNLAAWCAAGGVYAIAGLRGGYEYGEAWHHAGRRANKQNVFDDFHAAADWLVAQGYTSRDRLALHGGSNGGLLMGVAVTQRPDLAPAVWCAVPLLDMIRFPQFLIARLWTDEYGDPDVAEEFGWLHAYSPYHHVHDGGAYPAVLFTTAEGDTRVDPCHARKMAAALTAASSTRPSGPSCWRRPGVPGTASASRPACA
jgi:prolyl oligopeptidase